MEALQHSASRARPGERFAPYWVIAGVLFLYLLPGLIGHDPWKPDEGYVFDIVDHIIRTGHWVIPRLAGQPFMEKPPLYYLVAAALPACCRRGCRWTTAPVAPADCLPL